MNICSRTEDQLKVMTWHDDIMSNAYSNDVICLYCHSVCKGKIPEKVPTAKIVVINILLIVAVSCLWWLCTFIEQ